MRVRLDHGRRITAGREIGDPKAAGASDETEVARKHGEARRFRWSSRWRSTCRALLCRALQQRWFAMSLCVLACSSRSVNDGNARAKQGESSASASTEMLPGAGSSARLSGTVSHSGNPVPATVLVESDLAGWGYWTQVARVEADVDGDFVAGAVPPGLVRLSARGRGFGTLQPSTYAVHEQGALAVQLELVPLARITGQLHAIDGASLRGWSVLAKHVSTGWTLASSSDDLGRFQIDELSPGAHDIFLRSPTGFEQLIRETLIVQDVDVSLGSVPVRATKLRGRAALTGPGRATLIQLHQSYPMPGAVVLAGSSAEQPVVNGRFEFGELVPGRYRLAVEGADHARGVSDVVIDTATVPELSIPVDRSARIDGVVVDQDGTPMTDGFVVIRPAPKLEDSARSADADRRGAFDVMSRRALIERDGRFVMGGLGAGDYQLDVIDHFGRPMSPGHRDRIQPAGPGEAGPKSASFTVASLGSNLDSVDVTLRVDSCRGAIDATITSADGSPVSGAHLRATRSGESDAGGIAATSDGSGWIQLVGLCEGEYQARAFSAGPPFLAGQSRRFTAKDELISLQLTASSGIRLRVAHRGQVIRRYAVALGRAGRRLQWVDAHDERTTFDWLSPGEVEVTILAEDGWYSGKVDVAAGELTDRDIELSEWRRIRGRLISPLGVPVASAGVAWLPEAPLTENLEWAAALELGEQSRRAVTDEQGQFELHRVYSDTVRIGFSTRDGAVLATETRSSTFDGTVWAPTKWPTVELQGAPYLDLGALSVMPR